MLNSLTMFAYGNGDFIYEIMTSANFFFKNSINLFKVGAMISLLLFMFEATGLMPNKGMDWMRFLRMYLILAVFVITPYKGKVVVHDVITNEDRVFNFNDHKLPFGMVVPISLVSMITHEMIVLYQQNFEIDENLNFTYSGMNFGANFIQSLDSANSYDELFNRNLDNYMQNCGFPLMYKAGTISQLKTSTDIFATLAQNTSDSRYVQQSNGSSMVVTTCSQAIKDITAYYNKNASKMLQNNATHMGVPASQYQKFVQSANATATTLMGISQGASAAMKQAIAQNMIMASIKNQAQSVGNGSLALAAYDAEAFQEYKQGSLLSGSAAARTVPIMVGVGYALLFLLYPIMIFMAITMSSWRAVGTFFQMLVAINLIPLLYEIFNYITTFYLQKKLGTLIVGQGYSYDVSSSLYSFTDNMIIAGNYLAASTPIIAYAIVSGSQQAMTSVFSAVGDPAKRDAEKNADNLARGNDNMGNISLDNASYNNISSNKMDDEMIMSSGNPMIKDTGGHGVRTNIGGETYDMQYKDSLNTGVNLSQMAQHSLQNSQDSLRRESSSIGKQWQDQAQKYHSMADDINSGQEWTKSLSSSEKQDVLDAYSLSTSLGIGFGRSGVSTSSSDSVHKDLAQMKDVTSRMSHSSNQHLSDAFNTTQSLANTSSHNIEQSAATSRALSDMKSNSAGVNSDFTTDWANNLRSKGIDPKAMSTEQQNASANAYANEYLHSKYGIKEELLNPTTSVSDPTLDKSVNSNGINGVDTRSPVDMALEQENMNKNLNDSKSNIQDNPMQTVKKQIEQVSQLPQDAVGTAMDAVAHPDRYMSSNNSPKKQNNTANSTTPQIPE
jgi:conjugal transfer mating pair stabilization protein TraG